MVARRWRWYVRILCGLALLPLLLWVIVLLVAPTGWARRQIVAQLESRSGRRVALEGLSVGALGGIRLTNLQIGSPNGTNDPWLKVADVRLDFGLCQMLGGHCRPSRVEVDGVDLRVLRRADGTVELADLIRPVPPPHVEHGQTPPPEHRVTVQVHRANVTVIDEPTQTRLALEGVEGKGYAEERQAVVEQLHGTLNGGELRFAARIDRTAGALAAEAQLRAEDVGLEDGMSVLRYVVPVLSGAPTAVKGRLNADIYVQGHGATWPNLYRDLTGHGVVAMNRVGLDGTPVIAQISRFSEKVGKGQAGSLRTDFVYQDRRITTDHFTLNVGRTAIAMSGWTDLDGRLDYQMKINGLNERLPDRARRILGDLKLDVGSLTTLTLCGTLSKMVVQVNGVPIDENVIRETRLRPDDRERLRDLGQKYLDKLLR
jgi:autotransporter translocation and assembly factor TamB